MSKTAFTTDNALTKKIWEEKLFRDAMKESYFKKFMGSGNDALVQEKTQLEKEQGDKITFGIRMRLAGNGVTSGQTLEGNEEKLQTADYSLSLEEYAHAVRDRGALDRQRAMFSIDTESKDALKDWQAEKIDALAFAAIAASPTKIFYRDSSGNSAQTTVLATAKAALSASNSKLTPNFLSYIKAWCKTGGNRSQPPLRPVKIGGKMYFVFLTHPDSMHDLKVDSTFQGAMREAQERGKENPLFENATAIWDGVIIHEHENVSIFTNGGGASVAGVQGVFMGAQSLCWAWGKRPEVVSESFDYGREHGYATKMIAAAGKPKFTVGSNTFDYGSVAVVLSRTQIADA